MKRRSVIICAAILAVAGYAHWEQLPPVGGNLMEEVGPGSCGARGRGYTFVAIGDDASDIYAFNHTNGNWEEMENIPECIDGDGAMAYAHAFNTRLFVTTDDENNLWIYNFCSQQGLQGYWVSTPLPEIIGPGVALAFQPSVEYPPSNINLLPYYLEGYLYLLVGNGTRYFYRRPFGLFPVAVYGLYPGNGSVVTSDNLTFDWLPHSKWTEYDLQVSSRPDFSELVIDTTISCGEFTPHGLEPGTYYWRVKGMRWGVPSDWSAVWSFTLGNIRNNSVDFPQVPSEGKLMVGDEPVFDWQTISGAVLYQLQVAHNPDFIRPVIDVTTPVSEFLSSETLRTDTYYWRTRYQDSEGNWST